MNFNCFGGSEKQLAGTNIFISKKNFKQFKENCFCGLGGEREYNVNRKIF